MVDDDRMAGFSGPWRGLRDSGFLRSYAWLAFIILVATLVVTLFIAASTRSFRRAGAKAWPRASLS